MYYFKNLIFSLVVIGLIMLAGWWQGKKVMVMFNIGVSLAVAAIPEGLPIVTVVTLALGVMRMAGKQAIVKKLPTVEALGCVNVICTDKTGTVTCNQMTATAIVTGGGDRVQVTGSGYRGEGSAEILSSDDHAGTRKDLERLAECSVLCNNASIDGEEVRGQPTEGALLALALKLSGKQLTEGVTRVREVPFSSESKIMEVICNVGVGCNNVSFVKGALDRVLAKCDGYLHHGKILPIADSAVGAESVRAAAELGSRGLRVLALARGDEGAKLTFLGLVALQDPPRPGVPTAVKVLAEAGTRTVMLTGDARETAIAIGDQIGLFGDQRPIRSGAVSGEDLDRMGDADLQTVVRSVQVFYRVSPRHKVRIVAALQSHGLIVAMTGDGVNDGVAVKRADVGIAMGSGTDVCKEAADVILLNDDFSTILSAIEEGKSIFLNIRNFLRFQLSTSIAALSLISISTLMDTPNPLNPMQILWINIIMDGPPAQSLGVEPADEDMAKRPPRNTKVAMLSRDILVNICLSAAIIVCGTLYVFKEMMEDGKITNRDTTMTFTCFVFFDMFNALSSRSLTKSVFQLGLFTNRPFCLAVLFSLVGQMLVVYAPPLQYIFQTEALALTGMTAIGLRSNFFNLTISDLLFLVALTSSIFIVSELKKLGERRMTARRARISRAASAKSLVSLV